MKTGDYAAPVKLSLISTGSTENVAARTRIRPCGKKMENAALYMSKYFQF